MSKLLFLQLKLMVFGLVSLASYKTFLMLNSALILPVTFVLFEHIIWPWCVCMRVGISETPVSTDVANTWNVLGFLLSCFCLPCYTDSTLCCTRCSFLNRKKRLKIFKNKIHIKMVLCTEIYVCLSIWHGNMLISEEKNTAVILRVNYNENKPIAILYS